MCVKQGGLFFGPNAVFDMDTSGLVDAGYFCFFYGPGAAMADPRVKRVEKLCAAAGGTFYLFEEDHFGEVSDSGWGCRFL